MCANENYTRRFHLFSLCVNFVVQQVRFSPSSSSSLLRLLLQPLTEWDLNFFHFFSYFDLWDDLTLQSIAWNSNSIHFWTHFCLYGNRKCIKIQFRKDIARHKCVIKWKLCGLRNRNCAPSNTRKMGENDKRGNVLQMQTRARNHLNRFRLRMKWRN